MALAAPSVFIHQNLWLFCITCTRSCVSASSFYNNCLQEAIISFSMARFAPCFQFEILASGFSGLMEFAVAVFAPTCLPSNNLGCELLSEVQSSPTMDFINRL